MAAAASRAVHRELHACWAASRSKGLASLARCWANILMKVAASSLQRPPNYIASTTRRARPPCVNSGYVLALLLRAIRRVLDPFPTEGLPLHGFAMFFLLLEACCVRGTVFAGGPVRQAGRVRGDRRGSGRRFTNAASRTRPQAAGARAVARGDNKVASPSTFAPAPAGRVRSEAEKVRWAAKARSPHQRLPQAAATKGRERRRVGARLGLSNNTCVFKPHEIHKNVGNMQKRSVMNTLRT